MWNDNSCRGNNYGGGWWGGYGGWYWDMYGNAMAISMLVTVVFLWLFFRVALLVLNFILLPGLALLAIFYAFMVIFGYGSGRWTGFRQLIKVCIVGFVAGSIDYYALELDQGVIDVWHSAQEAVKEGQAKDKLREMEVKSWGEVGSPGWIKHVEEDEGK